MSRHTIINVMSPEGLEAEYDSWIKVAEDICAIETGKGRVSNEILDNFYHVFKNVDFNIDFGAEAIVTIFASCLGYSCEKHFRKD